MLIAILAALASNGSPDDPRRMWNLCLIDSARTFAQQPEPAGTVADAAMAKCAAYEGPVREKLFVMQMQAYTHVARSKESLVTLSENAARESFDGLRAGLRGKLIAMVMEERAATSAN